MELEICSTGKWVDSKSGQVVDQEPDGPEGGRLLVAPGGVIDANIRRDIEAAEAAAEQVLEVATAPVETATDRSADKGAVDTATASPRAARR